MMKYRRLGHAAIVMLIAVMCLGVGAYRQASGSCIVKDQVYLGAVTGTLVGAGSCTAYMDGKTGKQCLNAYHLSGSAYGYRYVCISGVKLKYKTLTQTVAKCIKKCNGDASEADPSMEFYKDMNGWAETRQYYCSDGSPSSVANEPKPPCG